MNGAPISWVAFAVPDSGGRPRPCRPNRGPGPNRGLLGCRIPLSRLINHFSKYPKFFHQRKLFHDAVFILGWTEPDRDATLRPAGALSHKLSDDRSAAPWFPYSRQWPSAPFWWLPLTAFPNSMF